MRHRRPTALYVEQAPARLLAADPPWPFEDSLPGEGRGAGRNYGLLTHLQIQRFPLPPLADDCALVLWRVSSMVEEAYAVCRAWGFAPKSELVWRKMRRCGKCHGSGTVRVRDNVVTYEAVCVACMGAGMRPHFGMGRSVRNCHETAIIAHRGRPRVLDKGIRSVFDALVPTDERGKVVHSAKPPEFYALAERLYGGPKVELFSRADRDGWSCYGDEAGSRIAVGDTRVCPGCHGGGRATQEVGDAHGDCSQCGGSGRVEA